MSSGFGGGIVVCCNMIQPITTYRTHRRGAAGIKKPLTGSGLEGVGRGGPVGFGAGACGPRRGRIPIVGWVKRRREVDMGYGIYRHFAHHRTFIGIERVGKMARWVSCPVQHITATFRPAYRDLHCRADKRSVIRLSVWRMTAQKDAPYPPYGLRAYPPYGLQGLAAIDRH